jgi:superoxide dismutase, Fe-Mn family
MFELPSLPYEKEVLEPVISKRTLDFHYGKHHQKYVNTLNDLIEGTEFEGASLEDIIKKSKGPTFNNAAQVWNHTFYWKCMDSASKESSPSDALAKAIKDQWGSLKDFQEEFSKSATSLFGSGWVWLVQKEDGSLAIFQGQNAENPMSEGHNPVLTCDVWEHAYYLDYQNARAEYVKKFWDVVNWDFVSAQFEKK